MWRKEKEIIKISRRDLSSNLKTKSRESAESISSTSPMFIGRIADQFNSSVWAGFVDAGNGGWPTMKYTVCQCWDEGTIGRTKGNQAAFVKRQPDPRGYLPCHIQVRRWSNVKLKRRRWRASHYSRSDQDRFLKNGVNQWMPSGDCLRTGDHIQRRK